MCEKLPFGGQRKLADQAAHCNRMCREMDIHHARARLGEPRLPRLLEGSRPGLDKRSVSSLNLLSLHAANLREPKGSLKFTACNANLRGPLGSLKFVAPSNRGKGLEKEA